MVISLTAALTAEPRPRYRPGMERPLPDYSRRLGARSGCSQRCVEARLRVWRDSCDETSPRRVGGVKTSA